MFKWNFCINKNKLLKVLLPIISIPIIPISLAIPLTSCSINDNFDGPVKFPNDGSDGTINNTNSIKFNNYESINSGIKEQYELLKSYYESNFVDNEQNPEYNFPNWNNYFPKNNSLMINVFKEKFDLWIKEDDANILFTAYYNILNQTHCLIGFEWLMLSYIGLGFYDYVSNVYTENNVETLKLIPKPIESESYIKSLYNIYVANLSRPVDNYKYLYWLNRSYLEYEQLLINSEYFETFEQYAQILKNSIGLNTYMMNHKLPNSFYEDFDSDGKTTFWDFFTNKDEFPEEYEIYEKEIKDGYNFVLNISNFLESLKIEPIPPQN